MLIPIAKSALSFTATSVGIIIGRFDCTFWLVTALGTVGSHRVQVIVSVIYTGCGSVALKFGSYLCNMRHSLSVFAVAGRACFPDQATSTARSVDLRGDTLRWARNSRCGSSGSQCPCACFVAHLPNAPRVPGTGF